MHSLARKDEPFQYSFTCQSLYKRKPRLTLILHRNAYDEGKNVTIPQRVIEEFKKQFSLKSFVFFEENGPFGFNGCMSAKSWNENRIDIEIPIPTLATDSGECEFCDGTGKHRFFEREECGSCDGTGKGQVTDTKPSYAIPATLALLTPRLAFCLPELLPESAPPLQLLHVTTRVLEYGMFGAPLGGAYSPALVGWLSRIPADYSLNPVNQAVRKVATTLFPRWKRGGFLKHGIRSGVKEKGWFYASCPGDACEIHPEFHEWDQDEGYCFDCHNVDSPSQQLMLLAALAALTDMAVAEGVGQ